MTDPPTHPPNILHSLTLSPLIHAHGRSLGCIIAEMFNRRVLFQGGTSEGAIVLCLPQYRCIVHTLGSPK
jgi:hypothetical protein